MPFFLELKKAFDEQEAIRHSKFDTIADHLSKISTSIELATNAIAFTPGTPLSEEINIDYLKKENEMLRTNNKELVRVQEDLTLKIATLNQVQDLNNLLGEQLKKADAELLNKANLIQEFSQKAQERDDYQRAWEAMAASEAKAREELQQANKKMDKLIKGNKQLHEENINLLFDMKDLKQYKKLHEESEKQRVFTPLQHTN